MLIENVKKYYNKEIYDLNCAETILYAANDEYNMNLNKDTLKSVAAFGGGMAIESVCGAITGALAVIGIMYTEQRAHESERIITLTSEFLDKFQIILKSINCKELKELYKTENLRCSIMVNEAAMILDEMIIREKANIYIK